MLTNQGPDPLQLDLSLYDSSGKEVKNKVFLAARATNRLSVRQLVRSAGLAGSFGGIRIYTPTHSGSLDSLHVLFDEKASFSALMKMFDQTPGTTLDERDYARTKVWTLRAPMLALTNPDPALALPGGTALQPQLFVRNTVGKPLDVSLRFNWRSTSTTGKAAGPVFRLRPYETRRIDVAALQASNVIPKEANWASVILTTSGLPDEVVAIAASYDQTLQYGAQTPFSDQLAFAWEGSVWEYDAQHNSLITAGNGGTKPVRAAFTIYYNQGTQKYQLEQTLQPEEQMWIDVGKLIREHIPDKNGNVLPADLTSGTYEFRDLTDPGIGSLFEGKVIYDKTYGHVTYGCANCCANMYPPYLFDNPLSIPFQGGSQNYVYATPSCGGDDVNVTSSFRTWSTANTSIATVNGTGYYTGVGIGSTTTTANGYLLISRPRSCPILPVACVGGVNVPAQVPTYFGPLSAEKSAEVCPLGQFGYYADVDYQVLDVSKNPIKQSGMEPQEHVQINGVDKDGFSQFATPPTTDASGTFHDIPVGSCFGPPVTGNPCVNVVQTFQVVSGTTTFPITTSTTRRDCALGIRITVTPGAGTAPQTTYTFGTVN